MPQGGRQENAAGWGRKVEADPTFGVTQPNHISSITYALVTSHHTNLHHWIQCESSLPGMLLLEVLQHGSSIAYI